MSADGTATMGGERRWVLGAFAVVALLLFWRLGALPLLEPDEGRYADIPNAMLTSGDWVTPRLDGVLYFEKPPMHYWLVAGAIRAFGLNEFAARFPGAALGLAAVWLTWLLARSMAGPRAALIAVIALGTAQVFMGTARVNIIDMPLTAFATATLVAFHFARRAAPGWRKAALWHAVFAGAAVTVLTKGLIGVVIPGAVIGLFILVTSSWRLLREVPWLTGTALFAVIAVPWHWLMAQRHPDFIWFYFVHEHWLRFATSSADRGEPFWFFAAIVLVGCLPWTGLLPAVIRLFPRRDVAAFVRERGDLVFVAVWFAFVVAFFSISQSKLVPYILPGIPALAVLIGIAADRLLSGELRVGVVDRVALVLAAVVSSAYGMIFIWAGLGKVDRLELGGQLWPGFLAAGAVVVVAAVVLIVMTFSRNVRRLVVTLAATGFIVSAAIVLVSPYAGRDRNSRDAAAVLRGLMKPDDLVFSCHDFAESLPVYLGREIGVYSYVGELNFGIAHLSSEEKSARFPSHEEMQTLWRSSRRVFLHSSGRQAKLLDQDGLSGVHLLWQGSGQMIFSNQP